MPYPDREEPQKKDDGWGSWVLIVILFGLGIWPVALFLLFTKLFGGEQKQRRAAPPPLRTDFQDREAERARRESDRETAREMRHAVRDTMRENQRAERENRRAERSAQPSRAKSAAQSVVKSPEIKKSNARMLKTLGAILVAVGAYYAIGPAEMVLTSSHANYYIWEFLKYLAMAVGGLGMFAGGLRMDANMRRYARYLAVMGQAETVSLAEMSRKLGLNEKRVEKDLQKMIDRGYFGGQAYLDLELGYFFRSSGANAPKPKEKQPEPTPAEAEQGYSGILRNIRRANDRIADPALTAKIDRLEDITARIFKAVEADPKKRNRIDTFLNYYLPTTQKLLDAYAEFDAAGVEGENLRQAKSRIEKTMDSIVEGFEHQLDELYKSDAMDVDSDIRVMETMLHRDTASVERDFGLDDMAAAAPQAPAVPKARDVDLGGFAAQSKDE